MKRAFSIIFTMTIAMAAVPDLAELNRMIARFAPAQLQVDTSGLAPQDQQALAKLVESARVLDHIFMNQLWSGNSALVERLRKDSSPLGRARLHYFELNKGPWSDLDNHEAFLPDVPPKKLPGANFYPEDLSRDEFETWAAKLPKNQEELARGFFTVIRRGPDKKLTIVPYRQAYQSD